MRLNDTSHANEKMTVRFNQGHKTEKNRTVI